MSIRLKPTPSKYIVHQEPATADKLFSNHFRYEHLLTMRGGKVKDTTDLTELARGFYSPMSETLSENKAPFIQWVKGQGPVMPIKTQKVEWKQYGKPKRKTLSIGNPNTGVEYIGAMGAPFKVLFDIDHFQPSDQLSPVENGRVIIRIESYGKKSSGGYLYDAVLINHETHLPASYLTGKFWSRAGQASAYRSPLTGLAGGFTWTGNWAYLRYEVPLSTMTKEYSVDMETHLKEGSLRVGKCYGDDNPMIEGVTNRLEIEFDAAFESEMEHLLIHGEMSKHLRDPLNKHVITTGPGLYAYLEESNLIKYNPFVNSIDMIIDLIQAYWYDRVPANRRKLVLMTGQAGLELWHKWILEKFGSQPVQVEHNFILDSTKANDMTKRGYALGGFQFTKYSVQPFGEVAVGHMPMLDDTLYDAKYMPNSIYTVRSHEFIAFDWGMGSPGIKLFDNPDRAQEITIPGLWSPYGLVGAKNPIYKVPGDINLGDTYLYRKSRTFGIGVMNVSNILLFRPSV